VSVDTVLLVASRESANTWRHRLNLPGNTIVLPGGDEVRDRAELPHIGATCAGAAAASGVRVFSATSSQGLLHAMEMLYTVAGWRAPFVLVNVSRGLSAPITLEADHNDILAA